MSQLHFYVPDDVEAQIRRKASQAKLPLSKYRAQIVKREALVQQPWPETYFELFDAWRGEPQTEPDDLPLENRDHF
jgi:hypothetical protein